MKAPCKSSKLEHILARVPSPFEPDKSALFLLRLESEPLFEPGDPLLFLLDAIAIFVTRPGLGGVCDLLHITTVIRSAVYYTCMPSYSAAEDFSVLQPTAIFCMSVRMLLAYTRIRVSISSTVLQGANLLGSCASMQEQPIEPSLYRVPRSRARLPSAQRRKILGCVENLYQKVNSTWYRRWKI